MMTAKSLQLTAFMVLCVPIYILATWVFVVESGIPDPQQSIIQYYDFFPAFLQNSFLLTIIALTCCILTFSISLRSFLILPLKEHKVQQMLAYLMMGTSSLLILWLLFMLL